MALCWRVAQLMQADWQAMAAMIGHGRSARLLSGNDSGPRGCPSVDQSAAGSPVLPARSAVCGQSTTAVVGHEGVAPNSGESNSDTMPVEVDHGHRADGWDAIPGWPGLTRSSKGRQETQYDAAKP